MFDISNIKGIEDTEEIEKFRERITIFIGDMVPSLALSGTLIYQFFIKLVHNMFSEEKIPLDKWAYMDTVSGVINLGALIILYFTKAETYLELFWPSISSTLTKKDLIDYYMLIVLSGAWLWFFFYFLITEKISILLLTLFKMIGDAFSFILIMLSFFLFVGSIFTTLYQDYNE